MVSILMGVSVFSVGFLMLIVAVLDLLGISPRNFGIGERILVYGGGILLCVVGYWMASRRSRRMLETPLPPSPGFQTPPGTTPTGYAPGAMPPQSPGIPGEYQAGPPPEDF